MANNPKGINQYSKGGSRSVSKSLTQKVAATLSKMYASKGMRSVPSKADLQLGMAAARAATDPARGGNSNKLVNVLNQARKQSQTIRHDYPVRRKKGGR